ncbi:MAG: cell division protein ZapA [Chromatiales bacterium]|nr:cell division protein ZapA [Chromatiales bacterium]
MNDVAHVNVRILEKEYQIACPAGERSALLDSVELLNREMRRIRDSGKVIGLDRIAVMAALNMANELLKSRSRDEILESEAVGRVQAIRERVERALHSGRQMDL